MTFGDRLKEERKRLGLTQTEFASLGGIVKFTQLTYESGKSTPNLEYLQKLHQSGVDAYYVLTGQRAPAAAADALLAFPQGLNALVQAELAKGTSPGLLVRDLLQITQKVALKIED